jgi:hypothetical protein
VLHNFFLYVMKINYRRFQKVRFERLVMIKVILLL